jgi:hypothetical protein
MNEQKQILMAIIYISNIVFSGDRLKMKYFAQHSRIVQKGAGVVNGPWKECCLRSIPFTTSLLHVVFCKNILIPYREAIKRRTTIGTENHSEIFTAT